MSAGDWREAFVDDGSYLRRYGPVHREGERPPFNKKLCLTSIDFDATGRLLLELSRRDDCWAVKLDREKLRNGMVRGRVFLTSEAAIVELWKRYKVTDQFLCTIQDDDMTAQYR